MRIIPLTAGQNQKLNVFLNNQQCTIKIVQKNTGLFFDLYVNGLAIKTGVICLNLVNLIEEDYLGFVGRIRFSDLQGSSDPVSDGLGIRYQLQYLEPGIDY